LWPSEVRLNLAEYPFLGDPEGKTELVEFFDFDCPHCRNMPLLLDSLRGRFASGVKFYVKPRPVRSNGTAQLKARALLAARRQDKYWEMIDALWAITPQDSGRPGIEQVRAQILAAADSLGLDMSRFAPDLASRAVRGELAAAVAEAERYGINGVPMVLINGSVVRVERTADEFTAVLTRATAH